MSEHDSRSTGDPHLPASEEGTGVIPEERDDASDTSKPQSEADALADDGVGRDAGGEPQSWPGKSFGTIPPPG